MTKRTDKVKAPGKDGCRVKNAVGVVCAALMKKKRRMFYCTRERGHGGDHHAHGINGECCATWPNPSPKARVRSRSELRRAKGQRRARK